MKDNVKITIERAVNKAANATRAIVKVFEELGQTIPDEHVVKVFNHLIQTLNETRRRVDAARTVRTPVAGAFSLDAPVAEIVVPPDAQEFLDSSRATFAAEIAEAVAPVKPVKLKWVRPIGRLAGSKEPIYSTGEAEMLPADELTAVPDKTGFVKDAGFLDK